MLLCKVSDPHFDSLYRKLSSSEVCETLTERNVHDDIDPRQNSYFKPNRQSAYNQSHVFRTHPTTPKHPEKAPYQIDLPQLTTNAITP
jgi:hypothetical protein